MKHSPCGCSQPTHTSPSVFIPFAHPHFYFLCRITLAFHCDCQLDCIWNLLSLSCWDPCKLSWITWKLKTKLSHTYKGTWKETWSFARHTFHKLIHPITEALLCWLVFEPTYLGFPHRLKTSSSPGIPPGLQCKTGTAEISSLKAWTTNILNFSVK